jgi:hypothetical protein
LTKKPRAVNEAGLDLWASRRCGGKEEVLAVSGN